MKLSSLQSISRIFPILALVGQSSACSYFSQTVAPDTRQRIHNAVPAGMTIDDATGSLGTLGFDCTTRTGSFTDESGRDVDAKRFLECVKRPAVVSFTCENRDQVYIVPKDDVVDRVAVVRGPNCERQ